MLIYREFFDYVRVETLGVCEQKAIIWDLDNTLYRITPEFGDILDSVMARVCVEQLGVDLDFETAKAKVKESFAQYRDGGEIFIATMGLTSRNFTTPITIMFPMK